jgi:hypothetical protein
MYPFTLSRKNGKQGKHGCNQTREIDKISLWRKGIFLQQPHILSLKQPYYNDVLEVKEIITRSLG